MLKNLFLLSGFSTFVVIVIVGLNLYHNYQLSSLPAATKTRIQPILPSFDQNTLDNLKQRIPINVSLDEKSAVVSEDSKGTSSIKTTPSIIPTQPVSSISGATILESSIQL